MTQRGHSAAVAALAVAAAAAAIPIAASGSPQGRSAATTGPKVAQLIVFPSGTAVARTVRAGTATVKIGRRRCAVGSGTALASLLRSKPGKVGLHDYGSCSKRAADGGSLFVRSIRSTANKGKNGWVYKVGRKLATAGAADPTGPFGSGRLRPGQRVTWFFCRLAGRSCQRTLVVAGAAEGGGSVRVTVRGYDDNGKGVSAAGATVHAGGQTALTGADGTARLLVAPGKARLSATQPGAIRSFTETVTVR